MVAEILNPYGYATVIYLHILLTFYLNNILLLFYLFLIVFRGRSYIFVSAQIQTAFVEN